MKEITLCGVCAAKMMDMDGYKLVRLPRPVNNKVTCGQCGRRRYGGTYQWEKKEVKRRDLP